MPFELGIWTGRFHGVVNGTIGTSLSQSTGDGGLAPLCYLVVPARLTPPSGDGRFRAIAWIGAVPNRSATGSAGGLRPDFDPKFLSLTLKTDFLQMVALLELLRGGLVPAFQFEIGAPQSGEESPVTGWSMDFSFEISGSSQG